MLKLSFMRQPISDHAYSARKSFDATLSMDHNGRPNDEQRWLRFGFCDEPNGHLYASAIYPRDFERIARLMIETDPVAAIHAFGAALQGAPIERQDPMLGDDVVGPH
ncbi:hypothetical protein QCM77_35260 [Bradyrhizobium sp. SSUT18]|uniref:hypothetical protein n=1 Tax=unclassified Bradyrhizobium TaxID=2631580 RepID=UPI00244C3384|nr:MULTISPECIES: hypothetical protein [unclassified Bradyrhizobium]MDH2342380.1 hypothetical protein [Bradyrhizobium sp. SSUT77]MDH2405129.1 hypothetical protein [Bradyrhizobium sp. SSUT18]